MDLSPAAGHVGVGPGGWAGKQVDRTNQHTVNVYINGVLVGSVNLLSGPTPWPNAYVTGGGKIGVRFAGSGIAPATPAIFDDFGGGTMP